MTVPTKGAVKKLGRPSFEPSEEQRQMVMILAAAGHIQKMMAARLGINVDTLRKHFRAELDEGTDYANSALGEVLYKKALSGDIKAIENWFDRRGGQPWRKITGSEHAGPDGAPLRIVADARRDLSHLTEEELEQFHRLTAKLENHSDAAAQR